MGGRKTQRTLNYKYYKLCIVTRKPDLKLAKLL